MMETILDYEKNIFFTIFIIFFIFINILLKKNYFEEGEETFLKKSFEKSKKNLKKILFLIQKMKNLIFI